MKESTFFLFLKRLWLFSAVLSLVLAVYFIFTGDRGSAWYFIGLFVASGIFYLLRKMQYDKRKNYFSSASSVKKSTEVSEKRK